jgi:O-antigen ligase
VFRRYLPDYDRIHSAHSIYFQVLGEHGFAGLALFLLFWLLTWQLSRRIIKLTKGDPQSKWAYWLAAMIQVSLVGYFVGGMFLNLAYWDMPYYLMIALVVTWHVLHSQRAEASNPVAIKSNLDPLPYPTRSPPMSSS